MTRAPDFIVLGSPRCATTSLHHYFLLHPGVFVPEEKELHYFCHDIHLRKKTSAQRYQQAFPTKHPAAVLGEVSVWYLMSEVAAQEIAKKLPNVQLVAVVRNPLHSVPSLFRRLRHEGDEPLTQLQGALRAEPERLRRRHPMGWKDPRCLSYCHVYSYATQLDRYRQLFRPEQLHVVVYDDLEDQPIHTLDQLQRHLRVRDPIDVGLPRLEQGTFSGPPLGWRSLRKALTPLRGAVRWLPPSGRRVMGRRLRRALNLAAPRSSRKPITGEVRSTIVRRLRSEVAELSEQLDRDLLGLWFGEGR